MASLFAAISGEPVMDESMDERIFQQLEQLQRGTKAASLPQRDQTIDHAHAPYPAHEVRTYLADDAHYDTVQELADQPLKLDSFGKTSNISL